MYKLSVQNDCRLQVLSMKWTVSDMYVGLSRSTYPQSMVAEKHSASLNAAST